MACDRGRGLAGRPSRRPPDDAAHRVDTDRGRDDVGDPRGRQRLARRGRARLDAAAAPSDSVSYGIYLWHAPVFIVVMGRGHSWSPLARVVVAYSVTAVLVLLSWLCIERPFLALKPRPRTRAPQTVARQRQPGARFGCLTSDGPRPTVRATPFSLDHRALTRPVAMSMHDGGPMASRSDGERRAERSAAELCGPVLRRRAHDHLHRLTDVRERSSEGHLVVPFSHDTSTDAAPQRHGSAVDLDRIATANVDRRA